MDTNIIGYSGKVSITQDSKILYSNHNAGTNSLFNLLCSLLAVAQSNYSCYPAYISIISGAITSSSDTIDDYSKVQERSILVTEITITNRAITSADKSNTPTLKLSGLLTYDNLKSSETNTNQYSILLVDSTKTRILAYSIVDGSNSDNLKALKESKLNQASVNWELTFANSN